jgi:competence protein ComGC
MQKRIRLKNHRLWGFCLFLCVVFALSVPLAAQQNAAAEKPTMYTYVAEWSVPRAQWADMDKNADAERPILDKLVADGTITGYGVYSHLIHTEGEPTHGSWFSATSEGNLLKALEAIYAQSSLVTSQAQAASKHWDRIFQSTIYNGKPGKSAGYMTYSRWQVKAGQMRAYNQLMKQALNPILDKLVADGTITSYGTDLDDYHTGPIGVIYEYMTVPDAASLDKANKAIEDAFNANPALSSAYRSLLETEGHRDYLTRLRYMVNK